ncbi:MAG TPA: hypothetical protein PK915_09250, partial [Bacteroidales bacterium]|nr:hypothetical protein [Bacteroidales bacterium]
KTSCRAILDIGLLDIKPDDIIPEDETIAFMGASSDMMVMDLGDNNKKYKVGDIITFQMSYMGILAAMNSNYITKVVVN